MDAPDAFPDSLLEAVNFFANPDTSLAFVARLRWPDGVVKCPRCHEAQATFLSTRRLWKCRACKKQFSAKVGTIFEDSPIPLEKWLPALWLVVNCKNGISSYELARALKVSQRAAWFMGHRLRLAVQSGGFGKLLVSAQARDQGNLRQRRAVSPVPVPGRADLPVQQP